MISCYLSELTIHFLLANSCTQKAPFDILVQRRKAFAKYRALSECVYCFYIKDLFDAHSTNCYSSLLYLLLSFLLSQKRFRIKPFIEILFGCNLTSTF